MGGLIMARSAIQSRTPKNVPSKKKLQEAGALKRQALEYYELASEEHLDGLTVELRLQQAKSSAALALKYNPNDPDSLNLFSRVALELGSPHESREAIQCALDINPTNGGYWYSLGHIELAEQKLDAAESCFRKAIKYASKETKADRFLAYTLNAKGKYVEAFQLYRELAKTRPQDPHIRSKLFESAKSLTADYYDPELEHDLIIYLKWKNTNARYLSSLVCSMLERKFDISESGCTSSSDQIAVDPLFLLAMTQIPIKSAVIEKLIMALRYELLIDATHHSQVTSEYIPLVCSIAMYGHRSEFILPMTDAEKNMVEALKNLIDSAVCESNSSPMDISGALLLFSMYESWSKLRTYKQMISTDKKWPEYLIALRDEYEKLGKLNETHIAELTTISKGVSEKVKNQYESYPYPRWKTLDYNRTTHYSQALQQEYGNIQFPKYLNDDSIKILVAGCGTGRHALHVAKYFRNVDVTAVDLSFASLSYAKRKAQELDIKNIDFRLGDLLNYKSNKDKYHIIECSGVLHHIKEYNLALKNLTHMLQVNGLIKIALYSDRAREPVKKIRDLFKRKDTISNKNRIRMIRQAILWSNDLEGKELLTASDDFYSMSGVVDLLFHEFELRFTPKSIQSLCDNHNLKFLGFSSLNNQVKNDFKNMFGKSYDFTNLEQWDKFEIANPSSFSDMYQFYCQKN